MSPMLLPQLRRPIADKLLEAATMHATPVEVTEADLDWTEVGGHRRSVAEIEPVIDRIREIHGDVVAAGLGTLATRSAFDRRVMEVLRTELELALSEAARPHLWMYFSCARMPDLVAWRFPKQKPERFNGGVRDAFARLWWRAELFRNSPDLLDELGEDQFVALVERPSLISRPALAEAVARLALRAHAEHDDKLEDAVRRFSKVARRLTPFVDFPTLSAAETMDLLAQEVGLAPGRSRKEEQGFTDDRRSRPVEIDADADRTGPAEAEASGELAAYTAWSPSTPVPDPRSAATHDLVDHLTEIVELEGPVSRPVAFLRYARAAGLTKGNSSIVGAKLEAAVLAAVRSGRMVQSFETIDDVETAFLDVRGRVLSRARLLGDRLMADVPLAELRILANSIAREQGVTDEQEFVEVAKSLFDLQRARASTRTRLVEAWRTR